jgi:hypothetical protein
MPRVFRSIGGNRLKSQFDMLNGLGLTPAVGAALFHNLETTPRDAPHNAGGSIHQYCAAANELVSLLLLLHVPVPICWTRS